MPDLDWYAGRKQARSPVQGCAPLLAEGEALLLQLCHLRRPWPASSCTRVIFSAALSQVRGRPPVALRSALLTQLLECLQELL